MTPSHALSAEASASLFDAPLATLGGEPSSIGAHKGKAILLVNVASKCGLTPQYEGLERLQKKYANRGFTVLGAPCNQFGGQEPGTSEEIREFCSLTYGVTFPMSSKLEVNGAGRHATYQVLTKVPDKDGQAGDVKWNFEKFLLAPDGKSVQRFRPNIEPESAEIIAAIEAVLPG